MRSQKGGYLVIMAVLIAVLVGIGGLAIDLGRLFVLRSEMQNAADAAAVAAAMELDGGFGARSRAEAAARNLLAHNSRFAELTQLLGDNLSLEYYCAIRAKYDPDKDEVEYFCVNDYGADGVSPATNDQESHFVRVNLAPTGGSLAYAVRLAFLPALGAILDTQTEERAFLSATAVGGRSFYMCHYPPMLLCNPFEVPGNAASLDFHAGMRDRHYMNKNGGGSVLLKAGPWGPGNLGFLDNPMGNGAMDVASLLADEEGMGCTAPIVETKTGEMKGPASSAMNTRFDIYESPFAGSAQAASDYPPAPNVIDYAADPLVNPDSSNTLDRFGDGNWDRDTYWNEFHAWQGHVKPTEVFEGESVFYDEMSRWQVYNWEISSGLLPSKAPLMTTDDSTYDGIPGNAPGGPERRLIHVAVVNCLAHNLSGKSYAPIVNPEGFAKLFLTEHVEPPAGGGETAIWAEYVGWAANADDNFHTDVQLYE